MFSFRILAIVLFLKMLLGQYFCHQHTPSFTSCNVDTKMDAIDDNIYYLRGSKFGLFNIFSRLQIVIQSSRQIRVFTQNNKDDLIRQMKTEVHGFFGRMFSGLTGFADGTNSYGNGTKLERSPFVSQYLGLSPNEEDSDVTVWCDLTAFDPRLLALFLTGVFLFFFAEQCSRNVMFYYASGVTIGLLMSWTVIIVLLLKLMPYKKSLFVVTAAAGSSFGLYLTQNFISNLYFYATYHTNLLIWYTIIISLLTLSFLYYKGPPSNERFLNLTKWGMQLLGLLCIYNSTWAKEVAVTAIVLALATYHAWAYLEISGLFKSWISRFSPYCGYRQFPKKRTFLTEEEYREQAERETSKAMEELRGYCSSPECNVWKVVSRLKDPKRFASFMETGNMLCDDEIAEYDQYEPAEEDDSWISSDEAIELERTKDEPLEDEGFSMSDESHLTG